MIYIYICENCKHWNDGKCDITNDIEFTACDKYEETENEEH